MNEHDLEQRLQRTVALLDAAPGLMFVFRADGVFLECHGRDTLMVPPDTFLGKHFSEVLPPVVCDKLAAALAETLSTRNTVMFEYELPYPEGLQDFEARMSPMDDQQVVCLVRNVTQRVQTAKRLEESTALLSAVSAAQAAYIEGREPCDLFSHLLDQLLQLSSSEYGFIGEAHRGEDDAPFLRMFAFNNVTWSEETRQIYQDVASKNFEFRNLNTLFGRVLTSREVVIANEPAKDPRSAGLPPGHPQLRSFLGLPLLKGPKLVGMIGIANRAGGYDLEFVKQLAPFVATCANILGAIRADTERERYQNALARSEAHLGAVVDSVSDGIIVFDDRGIIQRLNPAMQRIFSCSTDDTIGKKLSLFMSATEGTIFEADLRRHVQRVRSTLLDKPYEFLGVREDGKQVPIELTVSELGPAYPNFFVGILRDVTERKRIERMQAEFVSMVSHELRTPLTSIRGALGLLDGGVFGELPKEMHELVTMAVTNSERLMRLIDDIIDIERIQSGQLSVRLERIDLSAAIKTSVEGTRGYAEQHGVNVVVDCDGPAYVRSDSHRIVQVLSNLISNAIKFSPQAGGVVVALTRSKGWVRVSVRDYGPGVPDQFKNRIFQRFAQADGSDKRLRGGTGLGLSIAKAIIEQLGGRIGYENVDTGGARFYFELEALPDPK